MKRPEKPLQGDQLALDELLPDAPEIEHKSLKNALKKRALYGVKVAHAERVFRGFVARFYMYPEPIPGILDGKP